MPVTLELSSLTFDEFVGACFDHPLSAENAPEWHFDTDLSVEVLDATKFIRHTTCLWEDFARAVTPYTIGQIDQGVWFLLGPTLELGKYLVDASISLGLRLQCIRSMLQVYKDFVAPTEAADDVTCFEMWWDLLCDGFWGGVRWRLGMFEPPPDFDPLSPGVRQWMDSVTRGLEQRDFTEAKLAAEKLPFLQLPSVGTHHLTPEECLVHDQMLETLSEILRIENPRCQHAALHGLGHLHHPGGAAVVTTYMNDGQTRPWCFRPEWVEQCRDGTVM